jgi:anti-sigma factor RsiW
MTDHLSPAILNALVDGELAADQLASSNLHLSTCPVCTSSALQRSLLKSATAKAGQRYQIPPHLHERLARLLSQERSRSQVTESRPAQVSSPRPIWGFGSLGWAVAAVLLLASVSSMLFQRATHRSDTASAEHAALVTEVFDQHVATLAGNMPPQVISTDRHTVKPWFQGKIPFSFNLPQTLPGDTTLDGANLTYLDNKPVAQLLYSIGKHRVSIFLRQRSGSAKSNEHTTDRSGFHVIDLSSNDLNVVAISDVDPSRLSELVNTLLNAQPRDQLEPR